MNPTFKKMIPAPYLSPDERAALDHISRAMTAFDSFQELVDAPGCRPTLMAAKDSFRLGNAYNDYQTKSGDPRRVEWRSKVLKTRRR